MYTLEDIQDPGQQQDLTFLFTRSAIENFLKTDLAGLLLSSFSSVLPVDKSKAYFPIPKADGTFKIFTTVETVTANSSAYSNSEFSW